MSGVAKVFEVTIVPHGDAPYWVREAWVGCRLPCAGLECGHIPAHVTSVLPRKTKGPLKVAEFLTRPPESKLDGYTVDQAEALAVLEKRNAKAAQWWRDNGYPKKGAHENGWRFQLSEIKVVETYTEAELAKMGPLVRHDDMETGTMRRMN